jgi:magnesium chelatase family protein
MVQPIGMYHRDSAGVGPTQIKDFCPIDETARQLLGTAMRHTCPDGQCHGMQLSARAYRRILKLARTIADLAGEERIGTAHIAEAIKYRPRKQG